MTQEPDPQKKKQKRTLQNVTLAGASGGTVSRYGSGVKEHLVAYSGVDNEKNLHLLRSLKTVARSKVNVQNQEANIKQQAGFSAEIKEGARCRAEESIRGKSPRTIRTDDIPGHVNDQLFDITSKLDKYGNPIPNSSAQMKFVEASPASAVQKMLGQDYQKYIDNDVRMLVPSDYYDGMKESLQTQIESLEKQIATMKDKGALPETIANKQAQLQKCKTLHKNLRRSMTSNAEAREARLRPALSTAKDITRLSHRAGFEQARVGAAFGGGMSFVKNYIDVCQGKKNKTEAALAVVGDTTSAAAASYASAFAGTAIKGVAQNAESSALRNLSRSNLPAYIATATLEVGKTLVSFFKGDIDGVQCLNELGEKGYGMVNSALYAGLGQILIPIPIIGALAGSMLGYALSSASYQSLRNSLGAAKLAREERIRIEKECAEADAMLKKYRQELEFTINQHLASQRAFFDDTFAAIKHSLAIGDIDGYISAANGITVNAGKVPLYRDKAEFDALMKSDKPIEI